LPRSLVQEDEVADLRRRFGKGAGAEIADIYRRHGAVRVSSSQAEQPKSQGRGLRLALGALALLALSAALTWHYRASIQPWFESHEIPWPF
jgi:hypothetical protein